MNCMTCGGLIMEPGKVYGYAGPVCHCALSGVPIQRRPDQQGDYSGISLPLREADKEIEDLRAQLAERDRLIEIKNQMYEAANIHLDELRAKVIELQSRHDRLRSALEWYADANNYQREERINGRLYILSPDGSDSVAIQALATVKETLL